MTVTTSRAIAFAASLLCSGAALASTTLIQDVRVFDGETMHAKRSVLVVDGKIASADFKGKAPAGATLVEGKGRTLLPGLIDAHVHAYRFLELPLVFGVTTQLDMFTGLPVLQAMDKAMANGEASGVADLFSAGTLVTAPGGHGTEYGMNIPTLDKTADAQAFVDARIAEGSRFIKIVMEAGFPGHPVHSLPHETVKAVIDAAHKRGKLAVVHISTLADARAALEMGADGLVHLFTGGAMPVADVDAFAKLAKAKKAFVVPTFSVLESLVGKRADDLLEDSSFLDLLNKEQLQPLNSPYGIEKRQDQLLAPNAITAALQKAGVPVLAGTDAGNKGTQYGASLHHELAALVKAGLTPVQALTAATSAPARAFRLADRGRIANGYKADLLLVDGDPSADISATHRIVTVWKDGVDASAVRDKQRALVAEERKPAPKIASKLPADGRLSQFSKDKLGSPLGLDWMASTDSFMGGKSAVTLALKEEGALEVAANVNAGFPYPWAGLALMTGTQPMAPADLSTAKVLKFRVRGDGKRYQVAMMAKGITIPVSVPFQADEAWSEVAIPLADFKGIDSSMITMIAFNAGPALGEYKFQIADIRLLAQ